MRSKNRHVKATEYARIDTNVDGSSKESGILEDLEDPYDVVLLSNLDDELEDEDEADDDDDAGSEGVQQTTIDNYMEIFLATWKIFWQLFWRMSLLKKLLKKLFPLLVKMMMVTRRIPMKGWMKRIEKTCP
mmetsp:Transcript_3383/g.5170  ORF Transcript_3383/g.5170 Transcript_3383/m.5170 type:complete len:131 (+) Transcript_3383:242-634(+)